MTYGLRVTEADGTRSLDTSTNVGVLHATVMTNGVNGSYTLPAEKGGQAVFAGIRELYYPLGVYYACMPEVTVNGRTVSWTYRPLSYQRNVPASVVIGTF